MLSSVCTHAHAFNTQITQGYCKIHSTREVQPKMVSWLVRQLNVIKINGTQIVINDNKFTFINVWNARVDERVWGNECMWAHSHTSKCIAKVLTQNVNFEGNNEIVFTPNNFSTLKCAFTFSYICFTRFGFSTQII